jgi:hypothetical protein
MKTYTYGRTPNEVIRQSLPHKYPMELNKSDMMMLLKVLNFVSMNFPKSVGNWARGMRQGILETIGIEEI